MIKIRLTKTATWCLVSALVGSALTVAGSEAWFARRLAAQVESPTAAAPASDPNSLTAEETVFIGVYEAVNRSVVNINTKSMRQANMFMIEVPSEGAGSGIVLDKQGHILTNHHVVEGAREIEVTLYDGTAYPAQLVGEDPITDIAVIRIAAPESVLVPVVFGDSARLKVGQRVLAIGNPFGLERTLTTGIISSLNRAFAKGNGRTLKALIQTDAAINPGNSGGPLLDTHSRLIGMNTAIASRTGENTGVGFAIPVTSIAQVVPQLIKDGRVIRADAGILQVFQTERGLLIAALQPGGPAELAGLRGPKIVRERQQHGAFTVERQSVDRSAADLITGVDGVPTKSAEEFLAAVENKKPGDEVSLTIEREGQVQAIRVKLGQSRD